MGNKERRVIIEVVGTPENAYDVYVDDLYVARYTNLEDVKKLLRLWYVTNALNVAISLRRRCLSEDIWFEIYDYVMRI